WLKGLLGLSTFSVHPDLLRTNHLKQVTDGYAGQFLFKKLVHTKTGLVIIDTKLDHLLAQRLNHTGRLRSMAKAPIIESLLKNGSTEWNKLRKAGKVPSDQTGATFAQLFSANADLSGLELIGSEWEKCDLSKISFRDTDLSNAYFHGGRLQDCDFRGAKLDGATFERLKLLRCDFSGAQGLDSLELDDVDMDRVHALDGEEAPPPPPPP